MQAVISGVFSSMSGTPQTFNNDITYSLWLLIHCIIFTVDFLQNRVVSVSAVGIGSS